MDAESRLGLASDRNRHPSQPKSHIDIDLTTRFSVFKDEVHLQRRSPRPLLHASSLTRLDPALTVLPMSSLTQHRALHIAEVVRHICDVASDRKLAILARTCKAFHEPAIQALWRYLSDLMPLVKCFPPDAWIVEGHKMRFARLPLPDEWTMFLKYAKLVRSLGFKPVRSRSIKLHPNVIDTLCALRPTLVLFPNLRALSWPIMDLKGSYLPSVLSLLGDEVTSLEIRGWDRPALPEQTLQASIALIAVKFRHLKSLYISFSANSDRMEHNAATSAAASSLVSGLHSLRTFNCTGLPLSQASILHLAALGTLQNLTVRLPDVAAWQSLTPTFQPFASLTELTLATTVHAYIPFGEAVSLPHIRRLYLYVVGDPTAQLVPGFFSAIRHQYSPTSLHYLSINPEGIANAANARRCPTVLRPADLRPLLEFTLMKDFDLSMECHHAFDDAFVLEVAKAWPHLETFHLCSEEYCVPDTLPSLAALAHLATHASQLTECGLSFDAASWTDGPLDDDERVPEETYGELRRRASTSSVFALRVGTSPIIWAENVALFLARVFPALDQLRLGEFDNNTHLERWEEVERYLPVFTRIRDDERMRMQQEREDEDEDDEVSESPLTLGGIDVDVNDNNSQDPLNGNGGTMMTIDADGA